MLWKTNVGAGYSTVSIVAGRLYTMGFIPDLDPAGAIRKAPDGKVIGSEIVWCLDAESGAVLWKQASPMSDLQASYGPATFSTPTVIDGCVYAVGKLGRMFCLDARDCRWYGARI